MRKPKVTTVLVGFVCCLGMTASAWAGDGDSPPGVDGRSYLIQGEWLYALPGLPPVGFTFENCYTFEADVSPDDGLMSGVWLDPLFPVPGVWVEHMPGNYTAFASFDGLTLIQNGSTTPGNGKSRLEAFSTVQIPALGGLVLGEIVSTGHAVDECPAPDPE